MSNITTAKREKNPVYDVFRLYHLNVGISRTPVSEDQTELVEVWRQIGAAVPADNRKQAIEKAAESLPEEERWDADFATVRLGEFVTIPRGKKVTVESLWGEPGTSGDRATGPASTAAAAE
jgi:hypothetical protein